MVELQILSKILEQQSTSMLLSHGITEEQFTVYSEEAKFVFGHERQYGKVPDKETFAVKFPEFHFLEVREPDAYLVETLQEEYLYTISVPVLNRIADIMQSDSREAVAYLQSQLPILGGKSGVQGVDIISRSNDRLEDWQARIDDPEAFYMQTGFHELDDITGGWRRGEELVVLFARTGAGKSWIAIKMLEHAWRTGKRVGLFEPEMSAETTGYRFDTLSGNISNTALTRGYAVEGYSAHINRISERSNPFFVVSPKDFQRNTTVSKLRAFVQANKLDILGVDGIAYMRDERGNKGDNKTTALTNISEDLMGLSIELGIPIIVVVQSNRGGVNDDDAPNLENIRDSDGIAHNASVVIAIRQVDESIELAIRKNRNGRTGDKLRYAWTPDLGQFEFTHNGEADNFSFMHNDASESGPDLF